MTDAQSKYSDIELRHELNAVFRSVYFVDKRAKHKLNDSYFLNFYELINYARANNIDEMDYIHSIRDVLLSCPQTYLAR
ncbi:MAG: hypothetical protein J6W41_00145 [Alphaproteobacteria bacterium]|nr:hypothetical protein [Alphaproteobacteria bacterium]